MVQRNLSVSDSAVRFIRQPWKKSEPVPSVGAPARVVARQLPEKDAGGFMGRCNGLVLLVSYPDPKSI